MSFNDFLKDWIPPAIVRILTGMRYGWEGNYRTWEDALARSTGYDKPEILQRVLAAALKVKAGEAVYERDSVLFFKPDYSFALLTALLHIASQSGKLCVLDYGGSLGSSYFQHRAFLKHLKNFRWCVLEQPHFADAGEQHLANEHLCFESQFEKALSRFSFDVILLGSSLPYFKEPYPLLETIISSGIPYLIIDRTPMLESKPSRLTRQRVHPAIYSASYPCWLLSKTELLNFLIRNYELIYEWKLPDRINIRHAGFFGFFLKRRQDSYLSRP